MTPENLRAVMGANHLNVKKLAPMIYVSERRIYRWLKGEVPIPATAWELLNLKLRQSGQVMSVGGDLWGVR